MGCKMVVIKYRKHRVSFFVMWSVLYNIRANKLRGKSTLLPELMEIKCCGYFGIENTVN